MKFKTSLKSWRSSQQSNLPTANQSRSKIFEIKYRNAINSR